ncbi:MAG: LysR family transcriptional regulator [Oscillibacter sp.]
MEAVKCEAFLAAAELGSLTATAELLGYTQSGVTRMIGTLEESSAFRCFFAAKRACSSRKTESSCCRCCARSCARTTTPSSSARRSAACQRAR